MKVETIVDSNEGTSTIIYIHDGSHDQEIIDRMVNSHLAKLSRRDSRTYAASVDTKNFKWETDGLTRLANFSLKDISSTPFSSIRVCSK